MVDGVVTEVPYGTAGSQRPDFYNPTTNQIVEVKNYTVTTASGRNNLANNIAQQYQQRKSMFPNASIQFEIDVCGQAHTNEMINDILQRVWELLGRNDMIGFMYE